MARPISMEERIDLIEALLEGESPQMVARRFKRSSSAVAKLKSRYERTGSVEPGKPGGPPRPTLSPHLDFIRAEFAKNPGMTQVEMLSLLARQRGVIVCQDTLSRFLRRFDRNLR